MKWREAAPRVASIRDSVELLSYAPEEALGGIIGSVLAPAVLAAPAVGLWVGARRRRARQGDDRPPGQS